MISDWKNVKGGGEKEIILRILVSIPYRLETLVNSDHEWPHYNSILNISQTHFIKLETTVTPRGLGALGT